MKRTARLSADKAARRRTPRALKKAGRPAKSDREPYDLEMIINAAVRVFNRRGYEGGSMEDIARETGLTKSSIYYHVASKEELLGRALERAFGPLLAILEEPPSKAGTAIDRLKYIVHRAVVITLEFVQEVELLQRIKGNTKTEREALGWRRRMDHEVASLVAQAARAGEIRPGIEPDLLTRLIFGMSNSITQWYRAEGRLAAEDIAAAVSTLVFEGVAVHGRRQPLARA